MYFRADSFWVRRPEFLPTETGFGFAVKMACAAGIIA
jgi:hypothetical protein